MKNNKTIFAGLAILSLLLSGCGSKASNNQPEPEPEHQHTYSETWSYDNNYHWHEATCGHNLTKDKTAHTMSGWSEITPTTATSTGLKRRHCNVCPYSQEEIIPVLEVHTIGQNGGTVTDSENNAELVFPQGALSQDTGITLTYHASDSSPVEESQESFLCGAEFGPSGTIFNEPVQVSLKLNSTPRNATLSVFCYDETYDVWDYVTDASISDGKVVFSVTHFSQYHVLDITPEMYAKFVNLVRQAQASGYDDQWVIDSYKDYLLNEKHIMDYYKLDNGLWYEPTYLFVSGNYHINGQDGDQDTLYFREGESNKVGNKYGLSTVGGETVSTTDYKKATDTTQETITVTIDLQYKLIKPTIELSAGTTHLEEGGSTNVDVYCHYAKPSNTLYPDLELEAYVLTIPTQLVHLSVNKTTLVTNASGRTSFTVTAIDEMPESIKVMFYVAGNWGEYAASYISFNEGHIITGHVEEEYSFEYTDSNAASQGATIVNYGLFDITVSYDIEGTFNGEFEGALNITNVMLTFNNREYHHYGYSEEVGRVDGYANIFGPTSNPVTYNTSFNLSGVLDDKVCTLTNNTTSTLASVSGAFYSRTTYSGGNSEMPLTSGTITVASSVNMILPFTLEPGEQTLQQNTLTDSITFSNDHGSTDIRDYVSFLQNSLSVVQNSAVERTTQTINVA